MNSLLLLCVAGLYLALLFAVAFYVDGHARKHIGARSVDAWIYALSIAVYCTSWTFYGSVGRSSVDGVGFIAVYIGPVLIFVLGQHFLRKIQRIAATQHITSIADFISSRYGKSQGLAGLATVIAVIGIMPYISLQLKAVSTSFDILSHYPAVLPRLGAVGPVWSDTAFYLALSMALFVIVFGTRHVDATERHRGMVSAVALESLVKLAAFLAVGVYVTYGMFDGVSDLFARIAARPDTAPLLDFGGQIAGTGFWTLTALGAMAIICLPRQFQVTVIESSNEAHLKTARWVFPIYLVAINLFVLPIALAGLLTFSGQGVSPDTFVLTLPIAAGSPALATLAFIGGLSAATGMIIVETIALSTMICNDLVMPVLIRGELIRVDTHSDIGSLVKNIRRAAIVFILLLGYTYVRLVGESYALVSIGLVSFCAAAQFAPAIVGALFWRRGSRTGALAGLTLGFVVWLYTLLLPSFARSGWLPTEFASEGFFFIEALRPYALFGIAGLDPISHSLLWSMVFNIGGYVLFSLWSNPGILEKNQMQAFVDVFGERSALATRVWSADVQVGQIMALLDRFVDPQRARRSYAEYAAARHCSVDPAQRADRDFIDFSEHLLAGAIGAALARVVIASAIREKEISLDGVIDMLSGASQVIETNWERTREAIENIPQGVCMLDAEHRLVVWNQRLFELLDFPEPLAVVGTPLAAILRYNAEHGEYGVGDVEQQVAQRLALADKREPHLSERVRPDGMVIEVRGKPLPGGGFVTTYTDITERKQAELKLQQAHDELERRVAERTRDLRESEERFRDLAESASDWFWQTDAQLRFTYVSERFFEATGMLPAHVLGKRRWEVAAFDRDNRDQEKWEKHRQDLQARRAFRRLEYAIPGTGAQVTHVRISGKPFFSPAGEFLGYRGTGTDITELVLAQDELLHSEKLAALGGLVAGVAHEINTPVGIGLTAASYLDDQVHVFEKIYTEGRVKRSEMEGFIRTARESSALLITNLRRAADLVRSFKQVAVDQSSEMRRHFALKPYVNEVLLSLHPKLKRTQHTVSVRCADDIALDSYPGAFSQIITNLVMNSLIHGFENLEQGHIVIDATMEGAELLLRYSDDGKGMGADLLKHMFEPFFTTKRGQGGSGLGMHVVYNLVTQTLRGRIDAASSPGQGVLFTLHIPLEKEMNHEHPRA